MGTFNGQLNLGEEASLGQYSISAMYQQYSYGTSFRVAEYRKPEYQVEGTGFVGMSFRLWREFNKLLVKEAETVRFFRDAQHEQKLRLFVEPGADPVKRRCNVLTHVRPIRAAA